MISFSFIHSTRAFNLHRMVGGEGREREREMKGKIKKSNTDKNVCGMLSKEA
jgi:hypothetical protein